MKQSGLNLVNVKEFNRRLILQNICTGRSVTRFQLAERAHLSTMTVSNLITDLLATHIIQEQDPADSKKTIGRNPKVLTLSSDSPVILGMWISKDFLYGTISDMSLQLLYTKRFNFDDHDTEESILKRIKQLIEEMVSQSTRRILGLGIAAVGVVDVTSGVMKYVADFHNIHSLSIVPFLKEQFDFPIFMANDMQASGLAELYFGCGQKEDSFLYVGIANGIGSAIISDHQLLKNAINSSGELGHMTIDYNGPRCACGSRGCLELYASAKSILTQISEECNIQFTDFAEAMDYCYTSTKAYSVLYHCSKQLTYGLNNFINLIDVPTIVMGHSAYYIPDEILISMEARLNRISVFKTCRKFRIIRSAFKEKAPLYGAVCLVLERLFSGALSL